MATTRRRRQQQQQQQQQQQKQNASLLHKLSSIDTTITKTIHTVFNPYTPTALLLLLELSADFRFSFPLTISLLLLSPPSLRPLLSPLLSGLLLDLLLVGAVKLLFRRPRPLHNHHPSMSAAVSADHYSFPSGHASRVFFVASVVLLSSDSIRAAAADAARSGGVLGKWSGNVDCDVAVAVVAVWAGLTAASRVLLGRHYVFDVVAGALLGVVEGFFAFRFLQFEGLLSSVLKYKFIQG